MHARCSGCWVVRCSLHLVSCCSVTLMAGSGLHHGSPCCTCIVNTSTMLAHIHLNNPACCRGCLDLCCFPWCRSLSLGQEPAQQMVSSRTGAASFSGNNRPYRHPRAAGIALNQPTSVAACFTGAGCRVLVSHTASMVLADSAVPVHSSRTHASHSIRNMRTVGLRALPLSSHRSASSSAKSTVGLRQLHGGAVWFCTNCIRKRSGSIAQR